VGLGGGRSGAGALEWGGGGARRGHLKKGRLRGKGEFVVRIKRKLVFGRGGGERREGCIVWPVGGEKRGVSFRMRGEKGKTYYHSGGPSGEQ